jgi:ribosomal-protein-serine acetyltransferase
MIRIIQHTDADEIFKLVSDNRVYLRKWLPWLDHNTSVMDTKKFIDSALAEFANNNSMVYVVIQGELICGIVGFNWINWANKSAGIGYWLAEQYGGTGIMTRACIELEAIGFQKMKLNKLEINVAEGNSKSNKLAQRLGYVNTGLIRDAEWLYDHYVNHLTYSKLVSEYKGAI